jgi:8-oxo-dGTP pyrophosphatase MutT (NUDIX family)
MTTESNQASGIAFTNPAGEVLLLLRGKGSNHGGTWAFPAGGTEDGETAEQGARREVFEETGYQHEGPVRQLRTDGGFTTFHVEVPEQFPVKLCDESDGYVWASPDAMASLPLHPGVAEAMRIAQAGTELDIARLMVDGILPSPQRCGNMTLFRMRVTGTGMAFRSKDDEHVYRPPELYLNDEFLARCNGLPVIVEHPKSGELDSGEYKARNVGSVFMAFISGEDVDCIARIYDDEAIQMMVEDQLSTSPTVIFRDIGENDIVTLENGQTLLIEGKPCLLDHLAICVRGVWDKGGEPTGVQVSNQEVAMTGTVENTVTADAQTTVKADAAPAADTGVLAQLLGAVSALTKRFDSFEEKAKEEPKPTAADKAKADAEEEAEKKAKADADEEADKKAKADAEAAAMADAAEEEGKSEAQAKADSVYSQFGQSAPRAMQGESLLAYRRRLASKLKVHSADYKDINLSVIADSGLLTVAENRIYADAVAAARTPAEVQGGQLLEIKTADRSGRMISTFRGHPDSWMRQFKSPARRVSRINKEQ